MEPPTSGSLMAISVAITTIGILSPDLLNMFLYLLLGGYLTPHPFVCYDYFTILENVWLFLRQKYMFFDAMFYIHH